MNIKVCIEFEDYIEERLFNAWGYFEELEEQPESPYKNILLKFLKSKFKYEESSRKTILQALRHFDEVGISNDLWEEMYYLDKDYKYFCIMFEEEDDIKDRQVDYIEEKL